MRYALAMMMTVLAAPLAARDTGLSRPTTPSGPWKVEQADSGCTLSRDYGRGTTGLTLGFRPNWQGKLRTILLAAPVAPGALETRPAALITVGPGPSAISATAQAGEMNAGRRLIALFVDETLPDPRGVAEMTVQIGREDPVALALPGAAAGFAALDTCQDKMMEEWGVFPYERAQRGSATAGKAAAVAVAAMPLKQEASWMTQDDYPRAALRTGDEGDSVILWTIGVDGLAHNCRTIASSGSALLDIAACEALTKHARYSPAKDALGRPIATHASRHVLWELPN